MRDDCKFYICPVCFATSETRGEHHGHQMIFCRELPPGHDLLKPLISSQGDLKSRAPRWFLEAVQKAAGIEP